MITQIDHELIGGLYDESDLLNPVIKSFFNDKAKLCTFAHNKFQALLKHTIKDIIIQKTRTYKKE